MNFNSMPCAVTADLNRYLSKLDEDDRWKEAVDARVSELLDEGGDYYPFSADNLSEALGEIDIESVATALKAGKHEDAGKALLTLVSGYWDRMAQQQAERDIEEQRANACHRCGGRGCRHCDEDYGRDY